jgi:hypothetical protein
MAVFVADSMSLMFLRVRPQTRVCIVNSSLITSILYLSCSKISFVGESNVLRTYNLVDHHEHSRLRMFHAFHITENVDPIPSVQARLCSTAVREPCGFRVRRLGAEKEYICSRVIGYAVNVIEHASPYVV